MVTILDVLTVSSILGYTAVKKVCLEAKKFFTSCFIDFELSSAAVAAAAVLNTRAQTLLKHLRIAFVTALVIATKDASAILRHDPLVKYRIRSGEVASKSTRVLFD